MLNLSLIIGVGMVLYYMVVQVERDATPISHKVGVRLERLWVIAQSSMRDKKYLRAEKALLTILKLDQKNTAAYNRLGILYSRQKEYKDAIECFEIASSIEPSASSLHNLGLIYYETENYEKAELAFESALKLDDEHGARHIAYAKVLEKMGKTKPAIHEVEKAVEIEPNEQGYQMLADLYVTNGDSEKATEALKTKERLHKGKSNKARVKRPSRVVY